MLRFPTNHNSITILEPHLPVYNKHFYHSYLPDTIQLELFKLLLRTTKLLLNYYSDYVSC